MTQNFLGRAYARYYAWLLRMGMLGAVAFGTAVAITGSVLTTAVVMLLIPGPNDFFWYGMIVAVISPALTAPGLSSTAFKMAYQLKATQTALKLAAETDALTGVANRRSFMIQAEQAFAEAKAAGTPFSVVMLDLDHFKAINDTHGHAIGDDVLHDVAQACKAALRNSDCFARFGGEEFVALLHHTDAAGATKVAEVLRKTVAALALDSHTLPAVTVSLGVASFAGGSEGLHDVLNEADRQLYAAKAAGRNRVMAMRLAS
ncbi:diguanylate cyclase (GGDEF) domain-containing protein [Devosia sp. YR412]|uniref:GGDEF domain-containing protein n=1 Tax=Devosia sp. YR412 TaxID=1881030 RepID=UPI0008CD9002|nr:GGDEF domain-containing protein [Devosia sp. YR412]SEQ55225.1 diguanylate cyclase (GGDEF) domain-containing protein [Devosia sp. YR412]